MWRTGNHVRRREKRNGPSISNQNPINLRISLLSYSRHRVIAKKKLLERVALGLSCPRSKVNANNCRRMYKRFFSFVEQFKGGPFVNV